MKDSGFIRSSSDGRFFVDPLKRFPSLLIDEMILASLQSFLEGSSLGLIDTSLLDLGAGSSPYREVYGPYFEQHVAFDLPQAGSLGITVFGSAERLPFADEVFDAIIFTEVLEHLPHPGWAMAECSRVLKPGGRLFLTVPFLNPLHEVPYDFHRFTPFALEEMARSVDLDLEQIREKGGLCHFALLFFIYLEVLFFLKLSQWCRLPFLHERNPLLWPLMIWPQQLAGWLWRKPFSGQKVPETSNAWSPVTLGYMAFLTKRPK